MNKVLILGIGGQDGSYLAEHLLAQGVEVHGLVRRSSVDNVRRLRAAGILEGVALQTGDITDPLSVLAAVRSVGPATIYNLADQDHVGSSYAAPGYSVSTTTGAVSTLLEIVRQVDKTIRVFQPCSATVFGSGHSGPCDESTPFRPESPYACAKAGAYYLARHYRREHGMYVTTAFLYGHNSPRQKCEYLLHRIAREAVEVAAGKRDTIVVRDPLFRIDVGHAREFVEGMAKLMSLSEPTDVVLATGRPQSVFSLIKTALYDAGVSEDDAMKVMLMEGTGPQRVMTGLTTKAQSLIGWNPELDATHVVEELVEHYRKEVH